MRRPGRANGESRTAQDSGRSGAAPEAQIDAETVA